jgi:hypothetical protein
MTATHRLRLVDPGKSATGSASVIVWSVLMCLKPSLSPCSPAPTS